MVIAIRTSKAMQNKRKANKYTGGQPRYGWKIAKNGKDLEICEEEQVVIHKAKAMKAAGWSLRNIGKQLEKEGHPPRRGIKWHAATVNNITTE